MGSDGKGSSRLPVDVPALNPKYREARGTPKYLPKTFPLAMIVGSRGSGKTYSLVQLIKMYDAAKTFDHLYLWAPCFDKDPVYSLLDKGRHHYELATHGEFTLPDFEQTIADVQRINKEYEEYERDLVVYKKFCRTRDIKTLSFEDLQHLERMGYREPQTDYKLGAPTHLLVFDDCVGNKDLYRSDSKGAVASWVIKHRHDRCGVIFVSQIFSNAVPKQIRSNLSFVMLFAQKNEGIRKNASMEFSSFVSAEDFATMWELATEKPHSFFYADFACKDPRERFRIGFDKPISPLVNTRQQP